MQCLEKHFFCGEGEGGRADGLRAAKKSDMFLGPSKLTWVRGRSGIPLFSALQ